MGEEKLEPNIEPVVDDGPWGVDELRKRASEDMLLEDLSVGAPYLVEFYDCCVQGAFVSRLVSTGEPWKSTWDNGAILDGWAVEHYALDEADYEAARRRGLCP